MFLYICNVRVLHLTTIRLYAEGLCLVLRVLRGGYFLGAGPVHHILCGEDRELLLFLFFLFWRVISFG